MLLCGEVCAEHIKTITSKFQVICEELRKLHTNTEKKTLQDQEVLVSSVALSLFTNVPIEEPLKIVRIKIGKNQEKI
jgi:hypothetical protein